MNFNDIHAKTVKLVDFALETTVLNLGPFANLSTNEFVLLKHIFDVTQRGQDFSIKDMCEAFKISRTQALEFATRLTRLGYIKRNFTRRDCRLASAIITPLGIDAINQTKNCITDFVTNLLLKLTCNEVEEVEKSIMKCQGKENS